MSRRRYISTQISLDATVDKLAQEYGDFTALLYTWMIPHAEDDATITGDPDELMFTVVPRRRDKTIEDIIVALEGMEAVGLIKWDRENKTIYFPLESFYRYQSYIREDKRRKELPNEQYRQTPPNTAEQRKTAQNAVSPSPSPSPTPNILNNISSNKADETAPKIAKVMEHYNATFSGIWKRPLRLTSDRRDKIKNRLKTYTVEEICQAITNIRGSPYHCGENPNKQVYATPEFICRNDGMVDKWLNMKTNERSKSTHNRDLVEEYLRYEQRQRDTCEPGS